MVVTGSQVPSIWTKLPSTFSCHYTGDNSRVSLNLLLTIYNYISIEDFCVIFYQLIFCIDKCSSEITPDLKLFLVCRQLSVDANFENSFSCSNCHRM